MPIFLVFCLIWLILTALCTFLGYGIFEDVPLLKIGVYSCLISWCAALVFTLLRYLPQGDDKNKDDDKKDDKKK